MEEIQDFRTRAQRLEKELSALLQDLRLFLDKNEITALYEAESDLCDSRECLQDFMEHLDAQP